MAKKKEIANLKQLARTDSDEVRGYAEKLQNTFDGRAGKSIFPNL